MVLELWSNFMVVEGICQVFKMGDSRRRAVAAEYWMNEWIDLNFSWSALGEGVSLWSWSSLVGCVVVV
jgi:hypothetical protein